MSHSALLYFYVICIGKYMNNIFIEYITEIKICSNDHLAVNYVEIIFWGARVRRNILNWCFPTDIFWLYFGTLWLYFGALVIFWRAQVRRYILQLLVPDWGPRRRPLLLPLCANSPIFTSFHYFFSMKGKRETSLKSFLLGFVWAKKI